ncbi:MAG: hypothetical protein RR248_02060 [Clostridia bacterium]
MIKTKVVLSLISIITIVCLLASAVFAWFVISDQINSVSIKIAKIDSLISLFEGLDFNRDGTLDRGNYLGEDPASVPRHEMYSILGSPIPALSNDEASIDMNMSITDLIPTQKFTYKLHIVNNSEASNIMRLSFIGYVASYFKNNLGSALYTGAQFDNFINYIKALSIEIKQLDDNGQIILGSLKKIYLADLIFTSNGEDRNTEFNLVENIQIDSMLSSNNDNDADIVIVVQLETLEMLTKPKNQGGAGITMTEQAYQSLQGKQYVLPLLRVYLEIPG